MILVSDVQHVSFHPEVRVSYDATKVDRTETKEREYFLDSPK